MERDPETTRPNSAGESVVKLLVVLGSVGLSAGLASSGGIVTNTDHLRIAKTIRHELTGPMIREAIDSVRERFQ